MNPAAAVTVPLPDLDATQALGARIARALRRGDVVALEGPLGAGKTALARAILGALGVTDEVPSPTFTLVQTYDTPAFAVWHVDLYRLERAAEARELGLDDAFDAGVALIEWPDRMGDDLPGDRLDVALAFGPGDGTRVATLAGHGAWARRLGAIADG